MDDNTRLIVALTVNDVDRWEDVEHSTNDTDQLREEFADRLRVDSVVQFDQVSSI